MALQDSTVKYPLFSSNQRITASDQTNQGVRSLANISDMLEKTIAGTTQSQVLYGLTVSESATPAMTVDLAIGFGIDSDGQPLIVDTAIADIAVSAAHPSQARIDILEVKYNTQDGDVVSVDIIDPSTKVITPQNKNTSQYVSLEYQVKQGTPGSGTAASVTSGWVKLAEITVGAGVTTILDANIVNVNARYSTDNNVSWTADLNSTFKSANMKEHRESAILDHPNNSVTLDKLSLAVQAQMLGGSVAKVFFGECIWTSAASITITKDKNLGVIRAILKNGQVLDRTTDIVITITTAANRLDGEALSNNSWYAVIFYEDAITGNLEAKVWLLPVAVVSSSSTSGAVVLTTAYAHAFTTGMQVAFWKNATNFDTPYYHMATTGTYTVNALNDLYVASASPDTTHVVLNDRSTGISLSNYSGTDVMYGVSGFKPVVYADGTYPSSLASNVKWQDSGIRIRTDGSGNIYSVWYDDFSNTYNAQGSNWAGWSFSGSTSIQRITYIPPDATRIIMRSDVNNVTGRTKLYYETNVRDYIAASGSLVSTENYLPCLHGLVVSTVNGYIMGWN